MCRVPPRNQNVKTDTEKHEMDSCVNMIFRWFVIKNQGDSGRFTDRKGVIQAIYKAVEQLAVRLVCYSLIQLRTIIAPKTVPRICQNTIESSDIPSGRTSVSFRPMLPVEIEECNFHDRPITYSSLCFLKPWPACWHALINGQQQRRTIKVARR